MPERPSTQPRPVTAATVAMTRMPNDFCPLFISDSSRRTRWSLTSQAPCRAFARVRLGEWSRKARTPPGRRARAPKCRHAAEAPAPPGEWERRRYPRRGVSRRALARIFRVHVSKPTPSARSHVPRASPIPSGPQRPPASRPRCGRDWPPDAAAAAAVLGRLRLPRRILHVLQGESLLNDATALLVYRIAVGAALGTVTLAHTGPIIALMAVGSPIAGWLLARLYLLGTARVRDLASFAVPTFVGSFGVWLLAARVGLSPIITMVTYGMALAREAPRRVPARNRISTYSVWETAVVYVNVL